MTDEEYLFNLTSAERKRIGRGDFNKKRQGGKTVRFPSDNLSRKEREAMNGEVKTYDMARPVKWGVFKTWPEDLQRIYLLGLRDKYNAYTGAVSEMFSINGQTLDKLQKKLGIGLSPGGRRPDLLKKEWNAFLTGDTAEDIVESKLPESPEGIVGEIPGTRIDTDVLRLAELLSALKGTGAHLTIEVIL